ncbi:MAG: hypothetical protein WC798_02320 [Candidatus Paceibacterota bacterium]|jgi:hypothetical protein
MADSEKTKSLTADDFKKKFNLENISFPEPLAFSNAIGIGVKKVYPTGFASVYGVEIARHKPQPTSRKSLFAHVAYGKDTPEGVILMSDKKLSDPIDLNFDDEFSFDLQTDKFYYKDQEIRPEEIFTIIDKAHKKPSQPITGFPLRCKLWFWRKFLTGVIKYLDIFLIGLLWVISGERIKGGIWRRIINIHSDKRYQIEGKDGLFEEARTMEFFGYKAKRWSVVFYCVLHLTIFSIFFWKKVSYSFIDQVFSSNFLALCYVVVSFATTESLVPRLLKSAINELTPRMFSNISDKKLAIS